MEFGGIQKLSCLDYPGLVACTVFTKGCNFRCPFCHNAPLVAAIAPESIPEEEILAYLKKRQGLLEGITVTGGEPLLHPGLKAFLEKVKSLGYKVKLDTNGSKPAFLKELVAAGLVDKVAMDIKNGPSAYGFTVGDPNVDLSAVAQSKNYLLSGAVDYEFRTTVVKGLHTQASLLEAAQWIAGAKVWYLQCYEGRDTVLAPEGLSSFTAEELYALLQSVKPHISTVALRGI
jgi:pyruvate formate lyase activating enzyme